MAYCNEKRRNISYVRRRTIEKDERGVHRQSEEGDERKRGKVEKVVKWN